MKTNNDHVQINQESASTCKHQKQVDSAIQSSVEKYQKHRDLAETKIAQGSKITKHQIKL